MTDVDYNERLQESLCVLSARGYILSKPSFPVCGGVITYLASRRMPDGGVANVHLDLRVAGFSATPETSEGRSGLQESGDVCELINRIHAGREAKR